MSFFNSIIKDLREKRLWPVAVVLLAGLVAVPMLLSKPAAKVPVAAAPHGSLAVAALPSKALPVVTVTALTSHERITGRARDPFIQQTRPEQLDVNQHDQRRRHRHRRHGTTGPAATTGGTIARTTTGGTGGTTTGGTTTGGTGGTTTGGTTGGTLADPHRQAEAGPDRADR